MVVTRGVPLALLALDPAAAAFHGEAGARSAAAFPVVQRGLTLLQPRYTHMRCQRLRMLESPYKLPYDVPSMPKPFADYEWDDSFPGTFKPGTRRENYELDDVLEMWEGRENPACVEIPQDQLWQVPLPPPEDIVSWLARIGLLEEDEDEAGEDGSPTRSGEIELGEEFDLDEDDDAAVKFESDELGGDNIGATLSDNLEI
jgi:hypothetical protein